MKKETFLNLLALAVIALIAIPVGASVFILGFLRGDSPCVLCWEQRIGMVIIALIGIFILRYGPRPRYLGLVILVGAFGVYMGIRQSALHAARDIGQGFSIEIFGAHTYVWSFLVFWLCIVAAGVGLLFLKEGEWSGAVRPLNALGKAAVWIFFIVVAANAFQAVTSTGPPPFMGQGDPVRYSFSPRHWVWSLEEWSPSPVSWRGRWAVEKPRIDNLESDPRKGPLEGLEELAVKRRESLPEKIRGRATDIAYDQVSDAFLLTTDNGGVYLADGAMKNLLRYTVLDTGYSVDISHVHGAAFVDGKTFTVMSWNKSFATLRINDRADAEKNFRYFRESFDRFDEIQRSRFSTVRARMMYAMSLGFDPRGDSFYTVTVPNRKNRKLVVSRFDRQSMALSEEYAPKLAPGSGLAFTEGKRSIDEYYVTGTSIKNRLMYAVSAAFDTLLILDLEKREVVSAFAVAGLSRPEGVAVKGDELYFLCDANMVCVTANPVSR